MFHPRLQFTELVQLRGKVVRHVQQKRSSRGDYDFVPQSHFFCGNFKQKKNLYCSMKAQTNCCPVYQVYEGMLPNQSAFLFLAWQRKFLLLTSRATPKRYPLSTVRPTPKTFLHPTVWSIILLGLQSKINWCFVVNQQDFEFHSRLFKYSLYIFV